ncbi:MAG TPA: site-2 protease family protein [Candidatus Saccharimonadales bacterium]|nr:site-2 protease family protein [Candidatus Saccharimonadales bacterium]
MPQAQGIRIGRILGIPIYLDVSWILIFALATWSLYSQFSADANLHWTSSEKWTIALVTSLLFFGSVVFHELAHSVVAQRYKIKVLSITLFLFGGLARIGREPSSPIQEFNIAIAGPIASGFLAAVFYGLALLSPSEILGSSAALLFQTNAALALFNLLPGFPLDGGRVFRAIVWGATKDFSRATRVAGASGKLIAYVMIALGIYSFFAVGKPGSSFAWVSQYASPWLALVGWFLLVAAQASVAQVTIRETLAGLTASDVMSHEVPTIPGNLSLPEYSSEVLRTGRRIHIVTMDDRLVGLMHVAALNSVPRDEWDMNSVQAVMVPREKILWASPEEPLQRVLERLMSADVNQMPVVSHTEDGAAHIIGMITREAILRVIQTRSELGAALNNR